MEYLYDKLKQYADSGYYGFHMPGHKRNAGLIQADLPYRYDITEIEGFDDLHHAGGILKEAQERAAGVYHADETFYLINGSTVGLLSAVMGCTQRGDSILMARNCHKSVYNAVFLNELRPVYIYPQHILNSELNGEITVEQVDRLLQENPKVRAVVITSPTYDGVVSDIRRIAETVHRRNIPLILDEAHGAHFGFHPYFPENGNVLGADVVIHSLHKTLPSLTQTGLLHMNGNLVDRSRVRRYLHILQSSSPSYVLMAGMDECVRMLAEKSEEVFDRYADLLEQTTGKLEDMEHMELVRTKRHDSSKLVISVKGTVSARTGRHFTGRDLYRCLLEKYHLQAEMAAGSYVVLMTSPADTQEGMDRLISALCEIDGMLENKKDDDGAQFAVDVQEQVYTAWEAELKRAAGAETVTWKNAVGRISLEYAYLYPPGIPVIVPGERIGEAAVKQIQMYEKMSFNIEGTEQKGQIKVLLHG